MTETIKIYCLPSIIEIAIEIETVDEPARNE
jgi:hypothetical protein